METSAIDLSQDETAQLWTFFRSLERSRLLDKSKIEQLRCEQTEGFEGLQVYLMEQGLLTPYQLKRIVDGHPNGLVLGTYRILDELGRGGFGQVYLAKHELMERTVALKVIAPELVHDAEVRELFSREVIATTRLMHPNIALAYDAGIVDGTVYFAMEYIPGPSLERYVEDHGPLPVSTVCSIALQTIQALQFAHEKGMVHRDIKPANLLLSMANLANDSENHSDGTAPFQVKVIDFGFARLHPRGANPGQSIRIQCTSLGTPGFISPEQANNYHDVDIRSDLYSLGCTLYYALSGKSPFDGFTTTEIMTRRFRKKPIALEALRPDCPLPVRQLTEKLMAEDPDKRFQTPKAVEEALMAVLWSLRSVDESQVVDSVDESKASVKPAHLGTVGGVKELGCQKSADSTCIPGKGGPVSNELQAAPLRDLWFQWCAVVDCLACARSPLLRESEYRVLQRGLVCAIQDGTNGPDPLDEGYAELLRGVVEPWVTLESLTTMNGKILADLSRTCVQVSSGLVVPKKRKPWTIWIFGLAILFVVIVFARRFV